MLSIQSLIQNAKQLSKSYEKNAMNAEGVIQQMAAFAGAQTQAGATNKDGVTKEGDDTSPPKAITTDPKVMIASLFEADQSPRKTSSTGQATASTSGPALGPSATSVTGAATALLGPPGSSSTCKPRSAVMHAIQRESTRVKALKRENHLLKAQLAEYQFALELIMSKYRGQMMELLTQAEACCTTILAQHESAEQNETKVATIALTNRLQDMKARFERSIGPSSEEKILEQRQLLHELILEHETLVELYQISKRYGSLPVDGAPEQINTDALLKTLKVELTDGDRAPPSGESARSFEAAFCSSTREGELEGCGEIEKENVAPLEEPTSMDLSAPSQDEPGEGDDV